MNAVSGGMKNIEVTKKGVSKASGLLYLGKKLGIAPEGWWLATAAMIWT